MTTTNDPATPQPTSMRTDLCGNLRPSHIGQTVSVCGWVGRRREHGEHLAFVDLRDYSGIVQCVVDNDVDVRSEYVVRITGVVRQRPEGTVNTGLPTGEIEIGDCVVEVLRKADPPPFPIDARADDVDENVRLQHRYLDLRRERMQKNLRVRSAINAAVRNAMDAQGFVEVETPMLVPSTPEGAREFLVPSRQGARLVLRAAAVAAAVQAAVDGGRRRSLLPDGPLPARRGPACRPAVRVHAARHGDELRRPGRRARRRQRGRPRRRRSGDGRAATADRTHHVARGDGPLRRRQARPALRPRARRADRDLRIDGVQGVRRRRVDQGHPRPRRGRGVRPEPARQADRPRQGDRGEGARVAEGHRRRRRRRLRLTGRQVPVGHGEPPPCAPRRAPRPAT